MLLRMMMVPSYIILVNNPEGASLHASKSLSFLPTPYAMGVKFAHVLTINLKSQ